MKTVKNISKRAFLIFVAGLVTGVLGLAAVRFLMVKNTAVHYHANFALYINGARDEFKSPLFYEEVQACDTQGSADPKTRAHLHDEVNDVVHVHDQAVAWNAFFNNLGYGVGNDFVQAGSLLFVNDQNGNKVSFILNGQTVTDIANRVIGDKDVLLVNYGSEDTATLQQRYNAISRSAKKYDEGADPATCSGSAPLTFTTRLKKAFDAN